MNTDRILAAGACRIIVRPSPSPEWERCFRDKRNQDPHPELGETLTTSNRGSSAFICVLLPSRHLCVSAVNLSYPVQPRPAATQLIERSSGTKSSLASLPGRRERTRRSNSTCWRLARFSIGRRLSRRLRWLG